MQFDLIDGSTPVSLPGCNEYLVHLTDQLPDGFL